MQERKLENNYHGAQPEIVKPSNGYGEFINGIFEIQKCHFQFSAAVQGGVALLYTKTTRATHLVGPVHQLPENSKILIDLFKKGHAVITNLPFFDDTEEE